LYFVGGILITIGGATMFTVSIDTHVANVYGYSILLGVGTGLIFNAGYTVGGVRTMIRTGSGQDVQRVMSMLNLSQLSWQLGSLLVGGQIFQSLAMKNLTDVLYGLGFSEEDIRSAVSGTQSTLFASLSPAKQKQATMALTDAISPVYIISMVTGAITVVCALLMRKEKLFAAKPSIVSVAAGA
jgi:hypothetical protein